MKTTLLALVLAASFALSAGAEEYPEFEKLMKSTAQAMDILRKAEKKTGPEVTRAAERLAGIYEEMLPFWRQRNAAKAVELAAVGKAAAVTLASAASSGNEEKAAMALTAFSSTCKSCHELYREKVADKYRIKLPQQ